jgi:AcrR family transcriptional regulator
MAYHHGDLPAALLSAVGMIVNEEGIDALTLRGAARRAGVSHGAPAHHFGDERGMLTAFAKQAAVHLERCVLNALGSGDKESVEADLVAIGLGFLEYSIIHPAHFLVASRDELLDTSDVALIAARHRVVKLVQGAFDILIERGRLPADDRDAAVLAYWALVTGLSSVSDGLSMAALTPGQRRARAHTALVLFARRLTR